MNDTGSNPPGWIRALALDDLVADEPSAVQVGGRELAFFRVADEVFATDNRCTHGDARLTEGFQMYHCLECPLHQGQFDVRTGLAMCAPVTEPIRTYPVRIDRGDVWVDLSRSASGG